MPSVKVTSPPKVAPVLKSHVSVELVHNIVLLDVAYSVIPPPSAVASVAPPTVNVIAPAVA